MSGTTVSVPEAVMERVHAELVRSFMEAPDYINKVVSELMKEPTPRPHYGHDPDQGKPMFDRVLRVELRTMIERSMAAALREKYQGVINKAVDENMRHHEMVEGSLAQAFAKVLAEDWKVTINAHFAINSESR